VSSASSLALVVWVVAAAVVFAGVVVTLAILAAR
jgi:hypothetical protein